MTRLAALLVAATATLPASLAAKEHHMTGFAEYTEIIDAAPDEVWRIVSDFSSVSRWHPIANASRLISGRADEPGAVRELQLMGGGTVREELVTLDARNQKLVYRMVTFPIPVTAQENSVRVEPANDGLRSAVTFDARFEPARGHSVEEIRGINEGAFQAAARGLAETSERERHNAP